MMTVERLYNTTPWGTALGGQLVRVTNPAARGNEPKSGFPIRP